jgi:hypothetical protein
MYAPQLEQPATTTTQYVSERKNSPRFRQGMKLFYCCQFIYFIVYARFSKETARRFPLSSFFALANEGEKFSCHRLIHPKCVHRARWQEHKSIKVFIKSLAFDSQYVCGESLATPLYASPLA